MTQESRSKGGPGKPGHRWHLCLPCPSASPPAHVPRSDCLLSSLQALTSQSLYRQAGPAHVTACLSLPAPVSSLDLQVSNFSPFPLPPPPSPKPECPARSSSVWGSVAGVGSSLVARSLIQGADEEIIAPAATDVLQDCLSKSTPKLVTKKGCFDLFHLKQGPNGQTRPRLLEARDSSTSKTQHQGYGSCLPALGSASTGLNCPLGPLGQARATAESLVAQFSKQ